MVEEMKDNIVDGMKHVKVKKLKEDIVIDFRYH